MGTVIEYECKGRGYAFDYANSVSDENGTVVSNDDLISYYYTTNINKIKVTCTKESYWLTGIATATIVLLTRLFLHGKNL